MGNVARVSFIMGLRFDLQDCSSWQYIPTCFTVASTSATPFHEVIYYFAAYSTYPLTHPGAPNVLLTSIKIQRTIHHTYGSMVTRQTTPVQAFKRGRNILKHIVNCQYSLLVSTATGVAGAIYFFIIGPRNIVGITGIAVAFVAVRMQMPQVNPDI
jgi:hypothetical protein